MRDHLRKSGIASTRAVLFGLGCAACAWVGVGASASCSDPDFNARSASSTSQGITANEDCPASESWFPSDGGVTPAVRMFAPTEHPDTECPFYRGAYQNFLIAMEPLANGEPAVVGYPTIDDAFTSATPHGVRNSSERAWLGAVRQAGERQVAIDQDHHTLYYGMHMNQAFVDFLKANNLQTVNGILNVDPHLAFPPGVVEYKTAWKDIDPGDFPGGVVPPPGGYAGDPGDYSNYITTMAWVPTLSQDPTTGTILEDPNHPRLIKVALVAVHSVFTLPGHPEFIWGTIQHVNVDAIDQTATQVQGAPMMGAPDDQPDTPANPIVTEPDGGPGDPDNLLISTPLSTSKFLLYSPGTPENLANHAYTSQELALNPTTQSFTGQQTSIYRMFPGSKSQQLGPDTAVISLNQNLAAIAATQRAAGKMDVRLNYRLVAAIWMDKPELFGLGDDGKGMTLQNDDGTNPLVLTALADGGIHPELNEGTFCGTPVGPNGASGDTAAGATANTVPGCVTRADVLAQGPTPAQAIEQDLTTNGTDSPFSILGGEDRLSSTSMESFTQASGSFPNCFSCHNTQPVSANGTSTYRDSTAQVILARPALINVSHMFTEFIASECNGAPDGPSSTCKGAADAGSP